MAPIDASLQATLFEGWPIQLAESQLGGRGGFTKRAVAAGELLLCTQAAAVAIDFKGRSSICCGCLALARSRSSRFLICEGCGVVSYCTAACAAADSERHSLECSVLRKLEAARLPKAEAGLARLGCALMGWAVHTAGEEEASLEQALALARDHSRAPQFQKRQKQRRAAASAVLKAAQGTALATVPFTAEILEAALEGVPMTEFGLNNEDGEQLGVAVVPAVAMLNHSCTPNVARRFDGPGRSMCLYALYDLPEGAEICHSYLDGDLPSKERREALMQTWCIPCKCARCLGTVGTAKDSNDIAGFDERFACACGAFRLSAASEKGCDVPEDECWCLAVQLRKSAAPQVGAV
eukprot:TRINITY_DN58245_c0_g1_i1.p1 TRINITY_DN58245_c0_g1~~TRINITY_DN58245_c0_g1_i1.p1  ORF type:complete len:352 (+),score=72.37 TRINITY_DN58245_c0_g1_i1:236-1291(+)